MMRSTGIIWSYTFCMPLSAVFSGSQLLFARTLSSSMVEACRLSRVTRMANCFFVPLSRKEWASTMAPECIY